MTFNDFRNLDPKQLGTWPPLAKGIILFMLAAGLLAAAWFLGWQGQSEALDAKIAEEEKLKTTFTARKAQAINLDIYVNQLKQVEEQFGTLMRQLPSKREVDGLLSDVNQAGVGRGLQFELFKPSPEKLSDVYAELPVQIRVTGNYHDFGAFASDVAQMPRIVTLGDVAITPTKEGPLVMDAVARTYRYLDEDELAAQRKKLDDAKKQKK